MPPDPPHDVDAPISRFVRPDTVRLAISHGDWLIVKRRLTAGEQRASFARMYIPGADGVLKVNPLEIGMAQITAYLVDWSLIDEAGAVVPIRGRSIAELTDILENLDVDSFQEIREAIQQHEAAMSKEREQEKKPSGTSGAAVTSPSRSGVTGASSGSVN